MRENSILKERIMQYLDYNGIKKSSFYTQTGAANGILSQSTGLSEDNLMRFLNFYPDINPEWLLTGKGEMLKKEVPVYTAKENLQGIPMLPFSAFAGMGDEGVSGVDFATIEDRYVIPLFKDIHIDFMLSVRGSSMYPKYSSGDVVACQLVKELTFIQWNKVYVIDTYSQGVILKRLKKHSDDSCVICKSDNENYDEFVLPKSEIRNIALITGVVRIE